MPFVKGDPNINRQGRNVNRPMADDTDVGMTNKALRRRELLSMMRKLKPHLAQAIVRAVDIMNDKTAGPMIQLRAAGVIIDKYHKLTLDVYGPNADPDDEGEEVQQQNKPLFSLKVIENEDKSYKVEE